MRIPIKTLKRTKPPGTPNHKQGNDTKKGRRNIFYFLLISTYTFGDRDKIMIFIVYN